MQRALLLKHHGGAAHCIVMEVVPASYESLVDWANPLACLSSKQVASAAERGTTDLGADRAERGKTMKNLAGIFLKNSLSLGKRYDILYKQCANEIIGVPR